LITDLEEFLGTTDRLNDLAQSRREVGNDIGKTTEVEGVLSLAERCAGQRSLRKGVGSDGSKCLTESIEAR